MGSALSCTARFGTAGWSIPREAAGAFATRGSHLERYARRLGCAEINSSFYRSHHFDVYQRWAAQTPAGFRFSAKLPQAITHEHALRPPRAPLLRFLSEVAGLGDALGAGDGRGALCYYRWHGSPRMYWSRYDEAWLRGRAREVARWPRDTECWCVFDNTAGGAATSNALWMQSFVAA